MDVEQQALELNASLGKVSTDQLHHHRCEVGTCRGMHPPSLADMRGEAELTDSTGKRPSNSPRRSQFARYAIPIGTMGGTLALMAVIYLGYDLAKGELAPCESIFQQTSVGLTTSIKFLKTEDQLLIGR